MLPHLDQIDKLMKKGIGLACIHFAVEVPKGKAGNLMKDWIGGYFEQFWSINPFWTAEFKEFPDHPIARGVKPFKIEDEWYYNMRFADGMKDVTAILTAIPPDSTRQGVDGPYSGNPTVRSRKGLPEILAWRTSGPTADAASASPAATFAGTGPTISTARWCSTRSPGWPSSIFRPTASLRARPRSKNSRPTRTSRCRQTTTSGV